MASTAGSPFTTFPLRTLTTKALARTLAPSLAHWSTATTISASLPLLKDSASRAMSRNISRPAATGVTSSAQIKSRTCSILRPAPGSLASSSPSISIRPGADRIRSTAPTLIPLLQSHAVCRTQLRRRTSPRFGSTRSTCLTTWHNSSPRSAGRRPSSADWSTCTIKTSPTLGMSLLS